MGGKPRLRPQPPEDVIGAIRSYAERVLAQRDADGVRLSHREHVRDRAALRLATTDPTGATAYDEAAYQRSVTLTVPIEVAEEKDKLDRERLARIRKSEEMLGTVEEDVQRTSKAKKTAEKKLKDELRKASGPDRARIQQRLDEVRKINDERIRTAAHLQTGDIRHDPKVLARELAGVSDDEFDELIEKGLRQVPDDPPPDPRTRKSTSGPAKRSRVRSHASPPDGGAGTQRLRPSGPASPPKTLASHAADAPAATVARASKAARIGRFMLELMPDTTDALEITYDALVRSRVEAQQEIRRAGASRGDIMGAAAGLAQTPFYTVRNALAIRAPARSVDLEFIGAVGMSERAYNKSLLSGWNYVQSLSQETRMSLERRAWKRAQRDPGATYAASQLSASARQALKRYHWHDIATDPAAHGFSNHDVQAYIAILAHGLQPVLDEHRRIEAARRDAKEKARRAAEEARLMEELRRQGALWGPASKL